MRAVFDMVRLVVEMPGMAELLGFGSLARAGGFAHDKVPVLDPQERQSEMFFEV